MFIYGTIVFTILNRLGGFNYTTYVIALLSFIISLTYGILWNTFHQKFHLVRLNYSWLDSFPSFDTIADLTCENSCVKWIYRNHIIHHLDKGDKCNFNIILPGADFILGTYRSVIDNTRYCKEEKEHPRKIVDLCNHQPTLKSLDKIHNFQ